MSISLEKSVGDLIIQQITQPCTTTKQGNLINDFSESDIINAIEIIKVDQIKLTIDNGNGKQFIEAIMSIFIEELKARGHLALLNRVHRAFQSNDLANQYNELIALVKTVRKIININNSSAVSPVTIATTCAKLRQLISLENIWFNEVKSSAKDQKMFSCASEFVSSLANDINSLSISVINWFNDDTLKHKNIINEYFTVENGYILIPIYGEENDK